MSPISSGKRILHGVLGGTGQTVVTILAAFIQLRLVLTFLPKELAGTWFLFLSIGAYFAYFDLGISPTLSREIGFITGRKTGNDRDNDRSIADLIATCQRFFQATAAVVFLLGSIMGGLFLAGLTGSDRTSELLAAWLIFTLGASLNLLGGTAFAALYGTGNVATERVIRAVTQLLGLALSALFLAAGAGIIGLAAAWISQNLIARLWGWKMLYRYHPGLKKAQGRASLALARTIAAPSLKWAAMGLGAILILQTDNPIIAAVLGVSFIPPYEAAAKIVAALMTFSLLIVTSSTPFISRSYAAGDSAAVTSLLLRNVRLGMAVMIILASFLAVFGDTVIDVWLGPGNFVGYPVLWTLMAMLTLEVHHVIHATATMAAGHLIFLRPAVLAGVMKIALSVLLSSIYGLWGVALGTLLAQLLTNNWYAPYATLRIFGISFRSYLRTIAAPLMLMALSMVTMNIGIRHIMAGLVPLMGTVLSFALSSAAGMAITYAFLLKDDEKHVVVRILSFWKR